MTFDIENSAQLVLKKSTSSPAVKLVHTSAERNLLQFRILQCTVTTVNNSGIGSLLWLRSFLTEPELSCTSLQLQIPSTATSAISNFVTVNSISRNQLPFHRPSSGSERVIKFPVYTVNFDLTSLIAPCSLHLRSIANSLQKYFEQ